MFIECERRFFARLKRQGDSQKRLVQGYLTSPDSPCSVRVRLYDHEAELTVKGSEIGNERASIRREENIPIPVDTAFRFFSMASGFIEKVRHTLDLWEVDVFGGDYTGVVIAEIELPSPEAELPPVPDGLELLKEITGLPRWTNQAMACTPPADRPTLTNEAIRCGCAADFTS